MNIDDMKFGELKQIAAMFSTSLQPKAENIANPFIGKYCIARCYEAGVHAGVVISVDGENVVLQDSCRLWKWSAADGVALSGLAVYGPKKSDCKFDTQNDLIYLTGVCELIPCSAISEGAIREK